MDRMLRNKKTITLFLLPSIIIFSATVILPILWSGYYSLFHWNGIGKMRFAELENFTNLMKDSYFASAFFNNAVYLMINLVGQLE